MTIDGTYIYDRGEKEELSVGWNKESRCNSIYKLIANTPAGVILYLLVALYSMFYTSLCPQFEQKLAPSVFVPQFGQKFGLDWEPGVV